MAFYYSPLMLMMYNLFFKIFEIIIDKSTVTLLLIHTFYYYLFNIFIVYKFYNFYYRQSICGKSYMYTCTFAYAHSAIFFVNI